MPSLQYNSVSSDFLRLKKSDAFVSVKLFIKMHSELVFPHNGYIVTEAVLLSSEFLFY